MGKADVKNVSVLSFAVFAMFFGAGNLIFPPYLGLETGDEWLWGFLCFIAVECGLAMLALVAAFRAPDGLAGVTAPLGKPLSRLIILLIALCMGPLVVVPRTAATVYELAVQPNFSGFPPWVSGVVYFSVVALACLRKSKLVGIVGNALAPIMLVSLAALILVGIVNPLSDVRDVNDIAFVLRRGLEAGYQTMDMMGALLLSFIISDMALRQGYTQRGRRTLIMLLACFIASAGLVAVYGGLTYLGATASSVYSRQLDRAELLLALTKMLLNNLGLPVMAVIVTSACVTTAIGFVSAGAECLSQLSGGRIKYDVLVAACAALSFAIANLGITKIVLFTAPVLELIYPVIITLVILSLFDKYIRNINVFRGAAFMGFAVAAATLIDAHIPASLGMDSLPLSDVGLQWMLPASLGGIAGGFIRPRTVSLITRK